jgi:hypothetical protein
MTEKVVFVSKDDYYIGTLTIGKVYDAWYDETVPVYSSTGFYYTITNDIGLDKEYYYGLFMTLKNWREQQINKIL